MKKESQQSRDQWWIWSREAMERAPSALSSTASESPEKTRQESQSPLSSQTEMYDRTGDPLFALKEERTGPLYGHSHQNHFADMLTSGSIFSVCSTSWVFEDSTPRRTHRTRGTNAFFLVHTQSTHMRWQDLNSQGHVDFFSPPTHQKSLIRLKFREPWLESPFSSRIPFSSFCSAPLPTWTHLLNFPSCEAAYPSPHTGCEPKTLIEVTRKDSFDTDVNDFTSTVAASDGATISRPRWLHSEMPDTIERWGQLTSALFSQEREESINPFGVFAASGSTRETIFFRKIAQEIVKKERNYEEFALRKLTELDNWKSINCPCNRENPSTVNQL